MLMVRMGFILWILVGILLTFMIRRGLMTWIIGIWLLRLGSFVGMMMSRVGMLIV